MIEKKSDVSGRDSEVEALHDPAAHVDHADDLALPVQREALVGAAPPSRARAGVFLQGNTAKKADQLLTILRERALL